MARTTNFQSDWASIPGHTIDALLTDKNMSVDAFAEQMNLTIDAVQDLLAGRMRIAGLTAKKLSDVLGASAGFWQRRDMQYLADLSRREGDTFVASAEQWLEELPIKYMVESEWIPVSSSVSDRAVTCLQFFNVPDIISWQKKYAKKASQFAAFKKSESFELKKGSVAAWLRQGEIQSEEVNCAPWNPELFRKTLTEIRGLTRRHDPGVFVPKLIELCAASGVAVVILRAPPGCPASGATRFISDNKALLLLSFRHLSDDHFWFSFFHEAGHLLLHGKDDLFVEGLNISSEQEAEANLFAGNILVPRSMHSEMANVPPNSRAVIKFAKQMGVSPGIIVGQMQHHLLITQRQLNFLKRRYEWSK